MKKHTSLCIRSSWQDCRTYQSHLPQLCYQFLCAAPVVLCVLCEHRFTVPVPLLDCTTPEECVVIWFLHNESVCPSRDSWKNACVQWDSCCYGQNANQLKNNWTHLTYSVPDCQHSWKQRTVLNVLDAIIKNKQHYQGRQEHVRALVKFFWAPEQGWASKESLHEIRKSDK